MADNNGLSSGYDDIQQELDLDLYVRVLWRRRKTVIISVLVTTSLALLYLFLATPEYSSDALLKSNPSASQQMGWREVSDLLAPADDPVSTALEVLVSRQIIGAVVDQLHLDILAQPSYFPVFGAPMGRFFDLFDDDPADLRTPFLGLSKWAWGGEKITVGQFQVPQYLEDTKFKLIKGNGESYQLLDDESNVIVSGIAGKPAQGRLKLPDGKSEEISILVTALVGHEGTNFSVARLPRIKAIESVQKDLTAVETAANSGTLQLGWESPSATLTAEVLNVLADVFVDQNVKDKRNRLDLMLAFIDSQLPVVRANLRVAEDEFNKYHDESGSVDVDLEASTLLAQLVQLEGQISNMALLQIDYQQNYMPQHPNRVALDSKLQQLRQEKARLSAKLAMLPANELQSLNVQKEVEIASQVYLLLQQRQQEFSVARAGLVGDFSIVDSAFIPLGIDIVNYIIIPVMAVLLGGFVGLVLILFRKRNIEVVETPEELLRFQAPLLAKVVRTTEGARILSKIPLLGTRLTRTGPTGSGGPDQGLSDLRVALAYLDTFRESGLILLATPSPCTGLAFIAEQLSRLFAASGKTVVVIDANLRDGHLHESMSLASEPGLADVLLDHIDLRTALQKIEPEMGEHFTGSVSLLSAGRRVSDPADALMSDGFKNLIESVKQQFDVVVVGTPPLLGSALALPVISAAKGSSMLILCAGHNVPAEIEFAMNRFAHRGRQIDGLILYDETSCPKTVA